MDIQRRAICKESGKVLDNEPNGFYYINLILTPAKRRYFEDKYQYSPKLQEHRTYVKVPSTFQDTPQYNTLVALSEMVVRGFDYMIIKNTLPEIPSEYGEPSSNVGEKCERFEHIFERFAQPKTYTPQELLQLLE